MRRCVRAVLHVTALMSGAADNAATAHVSPQSAPTSTVSAVSSTVATVAMPSAPEGAALLIFFVHLHYYTGIIICHHSLHFSRIKVFATSHAEKWY